MSRDRGEWIPWFCDDSASWLELSLAARGVAEGVARKMGRKRSELPLGSRGIRGLEQLLRRPWAEIEPAIGELLAKGSPTEEYPEGTPARLVYDAARRVLVDLDHESRRLAPSTERVRRFRSGPPPPVDETDETHETVSPVSPTQRKGKERRSEEIINEPPSGGSYARAREGGLPDGWRAEAEAVLMPTGESFDLSAEWGKYVDDRERKVKPLSTADWRYWIRLACEFAKRERVRESDRKAAAAARRSDPPGAVEHRARKPTAEESRRETEAYLEVIRRAKAPGKTGT